MLNKGGKAGAESTFCMLYIPDEGSHHSIFVDSREILKYEYNHIFLIALVLREGLGE